MGIGPLAQWKKADLPDLAKRLKWAFGVSVVSALVLPFVMGKWTPLLSLGLLLAIWIITTSVVTLRERLAHVTGDSFSSRMGAVSRSYWGMLLAHVGVAVFIVGVTMVKGFETESDVRMNVGETATIGGYTFRFDGTQDVVGPNYTAARGAFQVSQNGRETTVLYPEKRRYAAQNQVMTEAAIDPGLLRDLYVSLGEPLEDGAWSVRLYHKPFVDWIWGGCFIMALGVWWLSAIVGIDSHGASKNPLWLHRLNRLGKKSHESVSVAVVHLCCGRRVSGHWTYAQSARNTISLDRESSSRVLSASTVRPRKIFSPADLKGKVWLLNFWASWCSGCKTEHPVLMELAKSGQVPIYGMDYKDQRDEAVAWLRRWGNPYPVVGVDEAGRVGINYGVYGVPETYVIDKQGVIRYKQIGPLDPDTVAKKILPLVQQLESQ